MQGISIDDRPDAPVGTPAFRRTVAIHWEWTTQYSCEEIAKALGVTERTIRGYISDGPTDEVRDKMDGVESEVRMIAVAELKEQLKAAGHRSRTAEKPVKVWPEDGDIQVSDIRPSEDAPVVERIPIPDDYDLMPNEEVRYYARDEVRDILEQLTDLVGAGEPKQIEHSGSIEREFTDEDRRMLAERLGGEPET